MRENERKRNREKERMREIKREIKRKNERENERERDREREGERVSYAPWIIGIAMKVKTIDLQYDLCSIATVASVTQEIGFSDFLSFF